MKDAPMTELATNIAAVLARMLLSGLFLYEAWFKLSHYAQAISYAEKFGVPAAALPLALIVEMAGGALIVVGFATRLAALALAAFCLSTAFLFHTRLTDGNEVLHFGKDLGLAGGFLLLAINGAGAWSLDAWRERQARS